MRSWLRVVTLKGLANALEFLPLRLTESVVQWLAARFGPQSTKGAALAKNIAVIAAGAEAPLSPVMLERQVRRAFASYGQYWAETAKLSALPLKERQRRFVLGEGVEYLHDAYAQGRGVILAIPHTGSWDWGGSIIGSNGVPLTVVAEKLNPPALFKWFRAKRELVGMNVIGLDDDTVASVSAVLNAGGVIGLLCDRDLQKSGVEVDFFGHRVTLPAGPALFALRTDAVLLAACCYSGPGDGHYAVFTPPLDVERQGRLREDIARVTQDVAHALEGLIQRAPEQWHVLEDRFAELPCE